MERSLRAFKRFHLPTALWALITAAGLLFPGPDDLALAPSVNWLPALAHFVLCGLLAFLLYRSLAVGRGVPPSVLAVFAICFLYGGLLEVAQIWVPGRSFEVGDLVVNGLGALAGLLAARPLYLRAGTAGDYSGRLTPGRGPR